MTELEIQNLRKLDLDTLSLGLPGITAATGRSHVEACIVRFNSESYTSGLHHFLEGAFGGQIVQLEWLDCLTDQMKATYNDDEHATEWAACGVAFLLIINFTDFTIIRRSRKGTGFDYWLGDKEEKEILFNGNARLEVSGIKHPKNNSEFERRVKQKMKQVKPSDDYKIPAYIVVTDFSKPRTKVVCK